MAIVANNPNVGVYSRHYDTNGNLTSTGLRWGAQAAGFLLGISRDIDAGRLVEIGSGQDGEVVSHHPQNSLDHCAGVALNAQTLADALRKQNITEEQALKALDARLSQWYVGQSMSSLVSATAFYVRLLANGGNLPALGATLASSHWGTGGFPDKFLDSKHPEEDQTHHLVAFLSAGINDSSTSARIHIILDDIADNEGDKRLSHAAFGIGQALRRDPRRITDIGAIIYTNICLGKAGTKKT
jgi:hypothetical protein